MTLGASLAEGLAEAHAAGVLVTSPVVHHLAGPGLPPPGAGLASAHPAGSVRRRAGQPPQPPHVALGGRAPQPGDGHLDDETYYRLALLRAMAGTGGGPVVVGEDELVAANRLGREATDIDVDVTGTAGLAGLLALRVSGVLAPAGEGGDAAPPCVLFTGRRR